MRRTIPFALLALSMLASCKNGSGDSATAQTCDLKAVAGPDQSALVAQTVTLDGSASTVCGGSASGYTWSFVQVPAGSSLDDGAFGVSNGTSSAGSVTFVPDVVGSYVVSLVVGNGTSTSNADLLVVNIASDNMPPVANAGPDQSANVAQRVLLDGSKSSDPEGAALTFAWSLSSAPSGSTLETLDLYDSTTDHASFLPDVSGTYVLALVVGDGVNWSDPDFVTISIASENQTPIADAGTSGEVSSCSGHTLQLDGWGSYDPDGDKLTYQWTVASVPAGSAATNASFDDASLPNARFSWDLPGDYTFQLQVSDGTTISASDLVTYTTVDDKSNDPPVANAGADQTVEAEADCTTSDYVWTCESCAAEKFDLDGSASTDPNGDTLSYRWYDTSGSVTFDDTNTAVTVAHVPATTATYGTPTNTTFTAYLDVADCQSTSSDTIALTVACTGSKP